MTFYGFMTFGLILLVVTAGGALYACLRPARYEGFLARTAISISRTRGVSAGRAARRVFPVTLWLTWIAVGLIAQVVATGGKDYLELPEGTGALIAGTGWVVVFAGLSALMVVVPRTGRPRALVIRPCRGLSEEEAGRWAEQHAVVRSRKE